MVPVDIMRVAASVSARVLAQAIDDGRDADQVTALLSIVRDSVQLLEATGNVQAGEDPTAYARCAQPAGNVIMLAAYRSGRRGANSGTLGINLA
jgi:hypothetical protein